MKPAVWTSAYQTTGSRQLRLRPNEVTATVDGGVGLGDGLGVGLAVLDGEAAGLGLAEICRVGVVVGLTATGRGELQAARTRTANPNAAAFIC